MTWIIMNIRVPFCQIRTDSGGLKVDLAANCHPILAIIFFNIVWKELLHIVRDKIHWGKWFSTILWLAINW